MLESSAPYGVEAEGTESWTEEEELRKWVYVS